jgi:lipocalin-like protein
VIIPQSTPCATHAQTAIFASRGWGQICADLVSFELVRPDGSKQSTFGTDPKGIAFFDAGGHYIITVMRSDRAKFAINSSTEGTAEENKATAQGTIT